MAKLVDVSIGFISGYLIWSLLTARELENWKLKFPLKARMVTSSFSYTETYRVCRGFSLT